MRKNFSGTLSLSLCVDVLCQITRRRVQWWHVSSTSICCKVHNIFWSFWMWQVAQMVSILGIKLTTTHPLVPENSCHNITGYGHSHAIPSLQYQYTVYNTANNFGKTFIIMGIKDHWILVTQTVMMTITLDFQHKHKTFSSPPCPHQAQSPTQSSNQGSLSECKGVTVQGWPLTSI
jgi:hypothetical protein